jgi:protein-S-isoprenylcysteine O-methyltransferase Ste14
MARIRWSNIPLPEGHLVLLALGWALHRLRPRRLFRPSRRVGVLGGLALAAGVLLAGWSVAAAREQDLEEPEDIVATGPYALSRNPMYLAWNLIYLGAAARVNSAWLALLLPVLILFTHFFVIRREERQLEGLFGEAYREYRARVRRYL